jgi:hypothetical protein
MATRYEVVCIKKSDRYNPYERITHIGYRSGGITTRITQEDAIQKIEAGTHEFFVFKYGHNVKVIVATHSGRKYIKTENDGDQPDNLLNVLECS